VVIKWLTVSEERTRHLWNSNVYIPNIAMENTLCRKRDLSSLQNSGFCSKTLHSYVLHKWFWALLMLKHELWGQKLGPNMEEMQVTAAVLLKVSEDDLLHVFEKWGVMYLRNGVECCKNVSPVKDTVKKGNYCIYLNIRQACCFPNCQLKNEGLPCSCTQS